MSLADRHAAPDGTAPRLADERIEELLRQTPGWSAEGGRLIREFTVKNFKEALATVNQVGEIAEAENHHPDICIQRWNHVRLELYTHTADGISENDFILAAKFNEVIGS